MDFFLCLRQKMIRRQEVLFVKAGFFYLGFDLDVDKYHF